MLLPSHCPTRRTITTRIEVYHRPYADIYDSEKALVLFLELLLVEYLNRQNTLLIHSPVLYISFMLERLTAEPRHDVHVEALVPVGVQRLLDNARRPRLFAIDCGHGEGIREACRT